MIGKRSKFQEHERSKVQDQESGINSGRDQKQTQQRTYAEDSFGEQSQDLESDRGDNLIGEQIEDRFIPEQPEEGYTGQIEEAQEEEILLNEKFGNSRSSLSNSKRDGTGNQDKSGQRKVEMDSSLTIITTQSIKSDTDLLWDEICNGVKGKNSGIPMGFNRLNKFLGLRKKIYTTIGAAAGCGKTSLVDCAYVLNPYDWYTRNKYKSSVKFEVIYFSMERSKTYKLAKWLCMKIWKEENKLLTTDQLLSWQSTLGKREQEIAKFYIDNYFKEMMESGIIKIIDGTQNPTGCYKYMYSHALTKGKEIDVNQWETRYIPDNDNLITNVVIDHIGKVKLESIGGKYDKKLTVDKMSEYCSWSRDYLGYSPIVISQFNRTSYQDVQFAKKDGSDPDPTVEYWKDSGNVIEDCDVAISLFNPYKYNLEDYMDYKVGDFTDSVTGSNKFRGLKILKNSYGTDNVRIGLGFLGEVSLFKELTKSKDISQKEINAVITNDFFLDTWSL